MIQPFELRRRLPMKLHNDAVATTTEVWEMLVAASEGELEKIQALSSGNPDLLTCQYDYTCPLHLALREGHLDVARYLILNSGVDPEYRTHPYWLKLETVAEEQQLPEMLELLRKAYADPGLIRKWDDIGAISFGRSDEELAFEEAVRSGDCTEVGKHLKNHPEYVEDFTWFWGEGILCAPSKLGNFQMMELLVENGAKVPPISKWAKEYYFKRLDSAEWLLRSGMDPNHKNWRMVTLAHELAYTGQVDKLSLLLDFGAEIDPIDEEFKSTPLGLAARYGKTEAVELLLERGADPVKAGAPWATPESWASRHGHGAILELLASATN